MALGEEGDLLEEEIDRNLESRCAVTREGWVGYVQLG